ncbi:hypothetical protein Cgig2_010818 [Carnegiea gigantea]|uniref:DUF4283 domain-containing protein n=1 Tax=Carnegiea gigantea TaxID=171969 RepID=A0A9Q1GFM4_9CARY|nr:hypothetical protein Cgig2_010818 [Carnegiea gigantea]
MVRKRPNLASSQGFVPVPFSTPPRQAYCRIERFLFFDNKPFVVKGWNADLDIKIENLKSLPLWIRLLNLELKYWGLSSLSKIGSLIGIPMKTDQYTKTKSMIQHARMLIEVPAEGPFPEQPVQFEWIPTKCGHCNMLGHTIDVCKRKDTCKEWRPVPKPAPPVQEVSTTQVHISHPELDGPIIESNALVTATSNASVESNHVSRPIPMTSNILNMDEAWCLMGDFNALRFKDDRIGGNEVQDHELRELASLLESCELHELKSTGAYFSWINKTI